MKKIFMAIALCLIAVLNFNANAATYDPYSYQENYHSAYSSTDDAISLGWIIFIAIAVDVIVGVVVMLLSRNASNGKTEDGQVLLSSILFTPIGGFLVALLNVLTYEKSTEKKKTFMEKINESVD